MIIIFISLTFFCGCGSKKGSSGKNESKLIANNRGTVSSYDISLADNITAHDILGCYLPDNINVIRARINLFNLVWNGYVAAEISVEDFYKVIEKLKLVEKPNLLKEWPDAFTYDVDGVKRKDIKSSVESDMYYLEDQEFETYIAAAYVGGKMYFKRKTKYTIAEPNSDVIDFNKIRMLEKGEQHKPIGIKR